jgi:hypothetical protein
LFQSLQSLPVHSDAFASVFAEDIAQCLSMDEDRVHTLLGLLLSSENAQEAIYAGFVDALGNATLAAKAGVLDAECVCPDENWTYCLPLDKWFEYSEAFESVYGCDNGNVPALAAGELDQDEDGNWRWLAASTLPAHDNCGVARTFTIFVPANCTVNAVGMRVRRVPLGGNLDAWFKWIKVNDEIACFTSFPTDPIQVSSLSLSGEEMVISVNIRVNAPCTVQQAAITEIVIIPETPYWLIGG